MAIERWAVHLTIESSTKETIKERAREAHRSVSNYLSRLVEDEVGVTKEKPHERPAR